MNRNVLKQILFWVTEAYYEELAPQIRELKEAALTGAPEGVNIHIMSHTDNNCVSQADSNNVNHCPETDFNSNNHFSNVLNDRDSHISYANNDCNAYHDTEPDTEPRIMQQTLLVTDSPCILNLCIRQGFYAIALYHEGNRHEDFSATPYAVEDVLSMTYDSYLKAYQRLAGLPWDILETERLSLRESTVTDVDAFYRIYREPSITRYMENLFDDRDEERAYIENYIQNIYGFYGFGMWTVVHTGTGTVIGRAGLNVREGYELPELGFVTDVSFQRQGYTYEICHAILQYAFEELDFPKVQAFCHPDNTASVHLLQKLGFVYKEDALIDGGLHARYEISART